MLSVDDLLAERALLKKEVAERQAKVVLLDELIRHYKKEEGGVPVSVIITNTTTDEAPHNGTTGGARIRAAIADRKEQFTLEDIAFAVAGVEPEIKRPYISAVLYKMRKDGEILQVKKGTGNIPSTYRRIIKIKEQ